MADQYLSIGKIVASFGVNGEMILKHSLGKKTTFKPNQVLFFEEMKESYIPWFVISSVGKTSEETQVKLEGINTKEATTRLIQQKVWVKVDDFRKLVDKASPLGLLGYTLFNEEEALGKIEEVIEQPHQVLLKIFLNQNEALIPLHQETLDGIDHKLQQVHVTLPDGLLDIYK